MEEETAAEDEVCVLSSAGTRSSVCLLRMINCMGGHGFVCVYVCVYVCGNGPLPRVAMYTVKAWQ